MTHTTPESSSPFSSATTEQLHQIYETTMTTVTAITQNHTSESPVSSTAKGEPIYRDQLEYRSVIVDVSDVEYCSPEAVTHLRARGAIAISAFAETYLLNEGVPEGYTLSPAGVLYEIGRAASGIKTVDYHITRLTNDGVLTGYEQHREEARYGQRIRHGSGLERLRIAGREMNKNRASGEDRIRFIEAEALLVIAHCLGALPAASVKQQPANEQRSLGVASGRFFLGNRRLLSGEPFAPKDSGSDKDNT